MRGQEKCVGGKSVWAETGSVGAETGSVGAETGSDVKKLTKLSANTTDEKYSFP